MGNLSGKDYSTNCPDIAIIRAQLNVVSLEHPKYPGEGAVVLMSIFTSLVFICTILSCL